MYIRKKLNKFERKYDLHNIDTRHKNKIVAPVRLSKTSKSLMGNCVQLYDKIPSNIDLTDTKFTPFIKRTLISKAYYKVNHYIYDDDVWHFIPLWPLEPFSNNSYVYYIIYCALLTHKHTFHFINYILMTSNFCDFDNLFLLF